ncbi:hypothetical protein MSG28_003080 [Choristoneura fumiferana]|uniref:Uncharacterized protein n=1 Tax=Choristoneura fumiferana TaxID=7141 RepID=A0ACC0JKJ7_CHOFU|nr:hypothetical protein MSG28_003080 [Choristoneura fumiferana]
MFAIKRCIGGFPQYCVVLPRKPLRHQLRMEVGVQLIGIVLRVLNALLTPLFWLYARGPQPRLPATRPVHLRSATDLARAVREGENNSIIYITGHMAHVPHGRTSKATHQGSRNLVTPKPLNYSKIRPPTPCADPRNAGKPTSAARRKPRPPLHMGKDAWTHCSSARDTFNIVSFVSLNVTSKEEVLPEHNHWSDLKKKGKFPRHYALFDILKRALISANILCVLEPPVLCRTDSKRPDGLTLVPWQNGKCLLSDVTCVSTFAASHLS